MEAGEAVRDEAFAPLADRVPIAVQLFGQLLVGGVVVGRSVEDEPTAERQRLGRGTRADQGLQLLVEIRGEDDTRRKRPWHEVPPCSRGINEAQEGVIMAAGSTFVQTLAANL